ncbi:uncharacterized protein ACNS7B_017333 [Menidia menidia]
MSEQEQPLLMLAQIVAEMAAMGRDQAALSQQELGALQARAERRTVLLEAVVERTAAPAMAGMLLHRMTEQDDPQSFLGAFEATTAALSLPASSRGRFWEVKRAVLDRLGLSPEDHRRRFRGAQLGPDGRPFTYAQQLRDAATRWLQPGEAAGEQRLVEAVVQEQFVAGLPAATSGWVQVPAATGTAPHPQGVPQAAGLACWRCGRPGHFRRECPLMEVGQVIRVVGPPAPSPGPRGTYSVPVRIQGGTHQAMVDSGCTQSMVHQSLVRPGALLEAGCVDIMCVHGDVHRYPVVPVEIRYRGKKHSIKAAVSPRLAHPLILGTDWPGFDKLVGQCVGVRSRPTGTWDMCAVLSGDARSSDTADGEGELAVPPPETPLTADIVRSRDDRASCCHRTDVRTWADSLCNPGIQFSTTTQSHRSP